MNKLAVILFPLLLTAGTIMAQDDLFDFSGEGEEAPSSGVDFSGEISASLRSYFDDGFDSGQVFNADAELEIKAWAKKSEAVVRLNTEWENLADGEITWKDILDEAAIRYFFSIGYLEAGYTIVEWGKGDGMHAVDPVNPLDQRSGFGSEMTDMKAPAAMIRLNFYTGANSLLEFIYVPVFEPTLVYYDYEERWSPFDTRGYTISDNTPDITLENFQGGVRYTFSVGPSDLGFLYYYGYMHDPGFIFETATDVVLKYTRVHIFGTEGALAAGPFTFRMEAGYYLTEDTDGDNPAYYNNRFVYLGGFDITMPGTALFLSAQVVGDVTLKTDDLSAADVDALTGYGSPSHLNTLVVSLEYPFLHEKLNVRLSSIIMFEAGGYYISPEMTFDISDNLQFKFISGICGGKDKDFSTMYYWRNNDFAEIGLSYTF